MRRSLLSRRLLGLSLVLSLLAVACGGDEAAPATDETEPSEAAAAAEDPTEDPTEAPTEEATESPTTDPTEEPTTAPTKAPTPEVATEAPTTEVATEAPTPATEAPAPAPAPTPAPADSDPFGTEADGMGVGGAATYSGYTVVTDDTESVQVEIPTEWTQVDGRPYTDDAGLEFFDVRASTDLEAFTTGWDVPGIILNASVDAAQSQNEVALLDERLDAFSTVCTYVGRVPYEDPLYTGQADIYENCGGTTTGYLILGAVPTSRAFLIRVEVQVVEERDFEALDRALASFVVGGA